MNKKQKKMLARIIIAAVLLIVLHFVPITGIPRFICYLAVYLVIGYDIVKKAFKGIKNGQVFDENFLMAIATIGAFALAVYEKSGDYNESIAVMLFYQIGELFQSYAVGKSRRNITELMDIRPDYANIENDGKLEKVDPDEVEVGSVIVVQPGEKVPIDGVIVEGNSSLNTSALTGESLPRSAKAGDEIISGCINMTGVLKIKTTKEFDESTVSKILELIEESSSRKSRSENFISKFAHYYTPAVCYGALGTGNPAAACKSRAPSQSCNVGPVDLQSPDIPCNQLPVCSGHQYSAGVLCGNRWSQQCRCSGQRIQLSGNSGPDKICSI